MTTRTDIMGIIDEDNNVAIVDAEFGEMVTRLDDECVYPVGSEVSCKYEHIHGLILTQEDARSIGVEFQ